MLYPLRFQPIFRSYVWGGRRLETELGKDLPDGQNYAESWEIVDRPGDQSRVLHGALAGLGLGELVTHHGPQLLGQHDPQPNFPLLFKFLDAQQTLSVQVHPNDAQGAELEPPDLGKTEAWVILAAEPGSPIFAGLRPGLDRPAIGRAIEEHRLVDCLHRFTPKVGDCLFIPAGTVHALGAGLLVAEIQQASDTTYRLYDWDRVGLDGRPRPLHVDAALGVIDFQRGPVGPVVPQPTGQAGCERLVACEKFILERWHLTESRRTHVDIGPLLLACIGGRARIAGDPSAQPLEVGQSILIPACCPATEVIPEPRALLLAVMLPGPGADRLAVGMGSGDLPQGLIGI